MALYNITAYSPALDVTVTRLNTEDGSPSDFIKKADADASASDWIRVLQTTKFMDTSDWIPSVQRV